jgi:hypothetical protein
VEPLQLRQAGERRGKLDLRKEPDVGVGNPIEIHGGFGSETFGGAV